MGLLPTMTPLKDCPLEPVRVDLMLYVHILRPVLASDAAMISSMLAFFKGFTANIKGCPLISGCASCASCAIAWGAKEVRAARLRESAVAAKDVLSVNFIRNTLVVFGFRNAGRSDRSLIRGGS